jgi:ATP-dependent DNA ligase
MKPDNFKPMLAVAAETNQVKFPCIASVKFDGIRSTIFGVGTGFDDATRRSLWDTKESLLIQLAKVKYFEVGMQGGVPRFPVFISIRSELDMSN